MGKPQYRKKLEADVEEAACQRILLELGIFSVRLAKTSETGYPDRLFLLPRGRSLFIEFKRPGKEAREKQDLLHQRLKFFGHEVQVHATVAGAVSAVERAKCRALEAG